jgi:outer membrane scaffolding protein for murein synthesis (MipA/OmpV family)
MLRKKHAYGSVILAFSALMAASAAHAQLIPAEDVPDVNLVGLVGGTVPDFMGSSSHKGAVGPVLRYQFSGTQQYAAVLGPQFLLNVLDDPAWRVGPYVNFRSGRGHDVDDAVVKQMVGINNSWEGGIFVQYNMKLSSTPFHQVVFGGDIAHGNGTVGHLRAMYWMPFNSQTIGNIGIGTTYASSEWNDTYFSVKNAHDIALFPTLNGQAYHAGSGFEGVNIPFAISYFMTPEWLLTVGGRYEKLLGDAKDSPIVSQHGNDNQWIGGIGVSYVFR